MKRADPRARLVAGVGYHLALPFTDEALASENVC